MTKALRIFLVLAIWLLSSPARASVAQTFAATAVSPAVQEPAISYDVLLLGGARQPAAGISATDKMKLDAQGLAALASGESKVHALVQLYAIPTPEQVQALQKIGVELLEYVPNYTWMASIPAGRAAQVAGIGQVRWVGAWSAPDKLHPSLRQDDWASWAVHPTEAMHMVMLLLHADVPLERGAALAQAHGGVALEPIQGIHGMTVWLPKANLLALAGEEEVSWIEEGAPPLSPTNNGVRASMQVDPLYSAPYSLNGSGVRIFVFDGGTVRASHQTFDAGAGSRVTVIDSGAAASHATHVAGTAAGDGNDGRGKGVAPFASVLSAAYEQPEGSMLFWDNAGDIQADYATARNTYNADFGTNSIGSNTANNGYNCSREGDYGVSSNLLDGIVRGDNAVVGSPVLMTWANGNERTGGSPSGRCGSNYRTTAPPSCAKNPIHIGATNSDYDSMTYFSSWGPCDDGRLKPVISAPGCELGRASGENYIYSSLATADDAWGGMCGTSMATPAVAGVTALMLQQWRSLGYGGANDRPLPALVKAMLMHTARDLGQAGPDFIYGYGEVDAKAAIDLVRNGHALGGFGPENWGTDSISNGQTDSFTVNVPSGASELKVSLAWDDPAAAAYSAVALVNNLNLQVVAPDGSTTYYPWTLNAASPYLPATTGVNTVDNQEQVLVTNPTPGTWTVRVVGTSIPTAGDVQTYGLVYSIAYLAYNPGGCSESVLNGGFESGTTSWTLTGGARTAAPAAGHGSWSMSLGGVTSTFRSAYQQISIPANAARAQLSFWWYMTTNEGEAGYTWDYFYAELRNLSNVVLATYDYRSDGWQAGQWMKSENMDLTPWAGQTVRLFFTAYNNSLRTTTFWVDDISLQTCTPQTTTWWLGRNTSWNSADNWSNGLQPSCALDAVIPSAPAGGNSPTINADREVKNLTIQNGAQLNMSANTLGVCGNWEAQGTGLFNSTGGSVDFKGSAPQSISMAAGVNGQFANLAVNNASGVTLNQNLQVNGVLALNNGLVDLGDYHLILGPAASFGGTPSASNMLVASGAGEVRKLFSGPGSFSFPVGEATGVAEYSPAWLDFTQGSFAAGAYASVRLVDDRHPNNSATSDYLTRYWVVKQSGISDWHCQVRFDYLPADVVGNEALIRGVKYSDTNGDGSNDTWYDLGLVDGDNDHFGATVMDFSDFTGGGPGLPTAVILVDMQAQAQIASVLLTWRASPGVYLRGFKIYRSTSPDSPAGERVLLTPEEIPYNAGLLPGTQYTYLDETVEPGVLYYYWIQSVEEGGAIFDYGPLSAAGLIGCFLPLVNR